MAVMCVMISWKNKDDFYDGGGWCCKSLSDKQRHMNFRGAGSVLLYPVIVSADKFISDHVYHIHDS